MEQNLKLDLRDKLELLITFKKLSFSDHNPKSWSKFFDIQK